MCDEEERERRKRMEGVGARKGRSERRKERGWEIKKIKKRKGER
jgi:hypothetical protein